MNIGIDPHGRKARVATVFAHAQQEAAMAQALEQAGLSVLRCADALALSSAIRQHGVDMALVEDDGPQLAACLTMLRMQGFGKLPVVAVGRGSAGQFIDALRRGACDYAVDGEAMESTVNRVCARLALSRQPESYECLEVGGCVLDEPSRTLRGASGELPLTAREFGLAWVLFQHAGRVVGNDVLAQQVWGRDASVAKRTIEQHVWRLRRKLLEVTRGSVASLGVQAVHNVGYRLSPEAVHPAECEA